MLLETHTDHPRYVAYNVTPCGHYAVKTVLLISGHSFETTVWAVPDFEVKIRWNETCLKIACDRHQKMLDRYTFIQWSG